MKARYFLTVEACDGGADPRRSRLTLSVTVLDVDDNSPVFGQRTYKVDLPENSPEGTVILRLRVSGAPTWFTLAAIPRRTSRGKSSEEACPSVRPSVTLSLVLRPAQATDADLGSNLTYRIRSDGSGEEILGLFRVDPITGELSTRKVVDFEALTPSNSSRTFTVEAVDSAGSMPPGLASVTVTITVRRSPCTSPGVHSNGGRAAVVALVF